MSVATKTAVKSTYAKPDHEAGLRAAKISGARQDFLLAATAMSWQLAVVVLVPIIGGFKLDQALHIAPLFTLVGFALAMTGMALVVWRQLQLLSPKIAKKDSKK